LEPYYTEEEDMVRFILDISKLKNNNCPAFPFFKAIKRQVININSLRTIWR